MPAPHARVSCALSTESSSAIASLRVRSSSTCRSSRKISDERTVPVSLPVVHERSCEGGEGHGSAPRARITVARSRTRVPVTVLDDDALDDAS